MTCTDPGGQCDIADDDLHVRTSWTDASTALQQINKGRATGNRVGLWLRTILQAYLFQTGCFIQRHAGKVLFVGILVLATFCVGLKSAINQTDIYRLWVEDGGRLQKELQYVRKSLGEGSGTTNQLLVQTPKDPGASVLHPETLLVHLEAVRVATRVTVEMYGVTWKIKDLCYAPSFPSFDHHFIDQIMESLIPCAVITPLDCFWEGSKLLGPELPVTIPGVGDTVRWTSLSPRELLRTMKTFDFEFTYDSLDDYMKRAGITTGYQERPCLNPADSLCPVSAANKATGMAPDVGAELTGGCYGFATRFMHWPEDLIVGGATKNRTGHIIRAEALQTVIQLMGEREMFEFWSESYKVHNLDWSVSKAKRVLDAWQEKFTKEVLRFVASSERTSQYNIYPFSTMQLTSLLADFSEISISRIAIGYVLMLVYAGVSMLRWEDPMNSESGVGVAGVVIVSLTVAAGLGLCSLIGISFNASTTQVVPFLALGLGIDDMFLLAHTYIQSSNNKIPFEDHVGEILKRAGISVVLTSACNITAFVAAAVIPIPALRMFCLQTGLLVTFNLAAMLLVFPAVISLDLRRREFRRGNLFCCLPSSTVAQLIATRPPSSEPTTRTIRAVNDEGRVVTKVVPLSETRNEKALAQGQQVTGEEERGEGDELCNLEQKSLTWFAHHVYSKWLMRGSVKLLVVLSFLSLMGASVWGLLRVKDGLDLTDIVPRDTKEHDFLSVQQKYFGFYHMFAVTQGNVEYPTNQRLLREYHHSFTRIPQIIKNDDGGLPDFWLDLFRSWLRGIQKSFDRDWRDGCITRERWFSNASDDGILAYKLLVQTGYVDNPIDKSLVTHARLVDSDGIVNPGAFYNYLSAWVSNDALAYSASQANLRPQPREWYHDPQDVELKIPKSQPLVYTQLPFYLNNLGETSEIKDMITQVRSICDKFEERGLPNFPTGIPFTFWEQYLSLRYFMLLALACSLFGVFVVVTIVLVNAWAAAMVVAVLAVLALQLFGVMGMLGIKMSAIPAVLLVVAVGIGVEFTVHVCVGFLTGIGGKQRRVQLSLQQMFAPVVHGALSTLLGVIMLAFSEFDFVVRYFFYALVAVVTLGLLDGLVLLPVLLSLVGPPAEVIPLDNPERLDTPSPQPSPLRERGPRVYRSSTLKKKHGRSSNLSLTTISEEPQSWHSSKSQSHEIVVEPEVVVETTTQQPRHDDANTTTTTTTTHETPSHITTKVTTTAKVKVEVHTPLPSTNYKYRRRSDSGCDHRC